MRPLFGYHNLLGEPGATMVVVSACLLGGKGAGGGACAIFALGQGGSGASPMAVSGVAAAMEPFGQEPGRWQAAGV